MGIIRNGLVVGALVVAMPSPPEQVAEPTQASAETAGVFAYVTAAGVKRAQRRGGAVDRSAGAVAATQTCCGAVVDVCACSLLYSTRCPRRASHRATATRNRNAVVRRGVKFLFVQFSLAFARAAVPAGVGRMHEAKLMRTLALLPYVGDDVAFAHVAPRVESVLVTPRMVPASGRPAATTVMDV